MYAEISETYPRRGPAFSRKLPAMAGRPSTRSFPAPLHRLREVRARTGLSLEKLADRLNSNAQTIQRQETGETKLKMEDLGRYSEALGVDAAEILGYENLFRDPEKAALLQIFDALSPAERRKLIRMARVLVPADDDPEEEAPDPPPALQQAAKEEGIKLDTFEPLLWADLEGFVSRELEAIPETRRASAEGRDFITATLYLLALQDRAEGKKPDYSQYKLFISGQVRALRASRRRQPQA